MQIHSKHVTKLVVFAAAMFLTVAVVYAQDWRRADHKINGGRVRSNQRHAQEEALELFHLSQINRPVQKEEFIDFYSTIKRDLAASDKSLAKLEAEAKKVKEASDLVTSIKKHHAKVIEQCDQAEKKAEAEKEFVGKSSTEIYFELEAAQADTQKLLTVLKVENLEPLKKK